jgi:hypothetical protein
MSSEQPNQTLADYVALAFSPALIMGLAGSLVFFLLEVAYSGEYEGRLQWILFFFVFGAVLVARISITQGGGKAGLYGFVLGLLTWIGMQSFVEYPAGSPAADLSPLINLGLVAIVWWCANRLTWDCTHIDEDSDIGGEGLLQAAGIEHSSPQAKDEEKDNKEDSTSSKGLAGWWQRYQRYREERKKKKRTLGVWVVYFSLAALPLFGLGQSLIPAGETARRQYVFWLMTVYVGCGLGLLLTTCFLGLRRYLRQRKLQMPAAMTGVWLSAGGTLIVLLLAAGAFLPRPEAEYPLFDFGGRAGSDKRSASKFAFKGDSPGKDEGRGGSRGEHDPKAEAKAGKTPGQQGKGGDNPEQGKGGQGQGKDGDGQGKDHSGQGSSGKGQDKQGGSDRSGQDRQDSGQDRQPKNGGERANEDNRADGGKDAPQQGKDAARGAKDAEAKRKGESSPGGSRESSSTFSGAREALRGLAGVLKWVVFALVGLAVLFVFFRAILQFLANFTGWAQSLLDFFRNFWASLFGGPRRSKVVTDEQREEGPTAPPEMPFASFTNPFTGGSARRLSTRELIRYTFAAVQAWARERGMGRQPGETALEFVERLSGEVPALEDVLRRLVMLYGRAEYARGGLPANATEAVREFWERLEVVVEQPMAG